MAASANPDVLLPQLLELMQEGAWAAVAAVATSLLAAVAAHPASAPMQTSLRVNVLSRAHMELGQHGERGAAVRRRRRRAHTWAPRT